jgi:hypothetical protein
VFRVTVIEECPIRSMIDLGWPPSAMRSAAKVCLKSWLSRIRLNHDYADRSGRYSIPFNGKSPADVLVGSFPFSSLISGMTAEQR